MDNSKTKIRKALAKLGPLFALIILCAFLAVGTNGKLLTWANISNLFRQVPIVALMAAGLLIVILTGGIDLSAGSVLAVSISVMGVAMKRFGVADPFLLCWGWLPAPCSAFSTDCC